MAIDVRSPKARAAAVLHRHVQVALEATGAAADVLDDVDTDDPLGDRGTEYVLAIMRAQGALEVAARAAVSQLTPRERASVVLTDA